MEPVDLAKLETAIKYVERIAEGNNPVNNLPMEEDAVLNNPNVIRCMYFVKGVLEEVRSNGGVIGGRKVKEPREPFPFEILEQFRYERDQSIMYVLKQIQAPLEGRKVKKLSAKTVTNWLKAAGYLTVAYSEEVGKETTLPTAKGKELGIYTEVRSVPGNTYLAVIYNQNAQEFVVRNLEKMVNGETEDDTEA